MTDIKSRDQIRTDDILEIWTTNRDFIISVLSDDTLSMESGVNQRAEDVIKRIDRRVATLKDVIQALKDKLREVYNAE